MALLETQWITVQQKTFLKWLNSKLQLRNLAINDLVKDLSDGVRLPVALEIKKDTAKHSPLILTIYRSSSSTSSRFSATNP